MTATTTPSFRDDNVSIEEAARILGVGIPFVAYLVDRNELLTTTVDGQRRIPVGELDEFCLRRDAAARRISEAFAN